MGAAPLFTLTSLDFFPQEWAKNDDEPIQMRKAGDGKESPIFTQWVMVQDRWVCVDWEVAERASCISSLQSSRDSVTHCWVSALNLL
jgi:hypothetical protein